MDLKEASEAGANLHNTEAFVRRVRAMEQGLPFGGIELGEERKKERLDSIAKIERYFEVRLGLIESIRRDGYLSQAQLGTGHGEIGVVVNRSGQLLKWSNGRNRLAAAILADTPSIYVQVNFVHHQWIEHCLRVHGASPVHAIRCGLKALAN